MKKILFVNDANFIGGGVIAANRVVSYIYKNFKDAYSILTLTSFDGKEELPKECQVKMRMFPIFDEYIYYPSSFARLVSTIRKADVVHFHSLWTFSSLMPLMFAWMFQKKIISTQHAMPNDPCLKGSTKLIIACRQFVIIQWISLFVKEVVFLTNAQRGEYIKRAVFKNKLDKKSHIIPNAISSDFLQKRELANKECKNILFIGRLSYSKGFDTFLNIVLKLGSKDYCYSIVGKVKNIELYAKMKRLQDIGYPIEYIESVEPNEMVCYYDKSDVLVVSSCSEVFPLVILEAKARGIPVVVSNIPGMNELVTHGKNGYVFPLFNSDTASKKIRKICNSFELCNAMSSNNYKNVEAQTLEKIVPQILNLYK